MTIIAIQAIKAIGKDNWQHENISRLKSLENADKMNGGKLIEQYFSRRIKSNSGKYSR